MGEAFDILLAAIFAVVTIVIVVRGVRRGDPSKRIRQRAFFSALGVVVGLRGLFPIKSWRVSAGYAAVLLIMVVAALWRGRTPVDP